LLEINEFVLKLHVEVLIYEISELIEYMIYLSMFFYFNCNWQWDY